jgi:hypothetical protein
MPGYFECTYINSTERTLSITLHVAQDSLGNTGIPDTFMDVPIEVLNSVFEPIGLSFEICETRIMENYQFNIFERGEELSQTLGMYFRPNTINLYLVKTIESGPDNFIDGFAQLPGGIGYVFMSKDSQNFTKALIHEMGHYFGLYHTFEEDFGIELVDGSNCQTTGDLVCDTEADANSDADNLPFPNCNYTGTPVTDANGDFYVPPTNNYMSYYTPDCLCRFTPQQYNRMLEQYQLYRTNLW